MYLKKRGNFTKDRLLHKKKPNSLRLVSFCKLNVPSVPSKTFLFFLRIQQDPLGLISQPMFLIIQQHNSTLLFKSFNYLNFLSFIHSSINAFLVNKQKEAKNISEQFEIPTKPLSNHIQNQVFTQNSCSLFNFCVNIRS